MRFLISDCERVERWSFGSEKGLILEAKCRVKVGLVLLRVNSIEALRVHKKILCDFHFQFEVFW